MQSFNRQRYGDLRFDEGNVYTQENCSVPVTKVETCPTPVITTTTPVVTSTVIASDGFKNCGWIGTFFFWFIILTIIFWLIFYSVRPCWAEDEECEKKRRVDTKKILLAAFVTSIVIILIIWLIWICMCNRSVC